MKYFALSAVLIYAIGATSGATVGARDSHAKDEGAREVLGHLSANPYAPGSTADPVGLYDPGSVTNPHGLYGSRTSPLSAASPFATSAPMLEDSDGHARGKLSANPYDADSVSNPYVRYGSRYSPDSINNPYGAGNPYTPDSPHNRYGQGLRILAPR